jgi:hypothetical protein
MNRVPGPSRSRKTQTQYHGPSVLSPCVEPWTAQLLKDHIILRSPACDRLSRLGKCENNPKGRENNELSSYYTVARAITSGDLEVHPNLNCGY